jgi:hypothetical protein
VIYFRYKIPQAHSLYTGDEQGEVTGKPEVLCCLLWSLLCVFPVGRRRCQRFDRLRAVEPR